MIDAHKLIEVVYAGAKVPEYALRSIYVNIHNMAKKGVPIRSRTTYRIGA